jgi:hypothetical protein
MAIFLSFLFLNGNCLRTSSMKLFQVKREEKAEKGAGQEKVDPNLKRTNENQTFH